MKRMTILLSAVITISVLWFLPFSPAIDISANAQEQESAASEQTLIVAQVAQPPAQQVQPAQSAQPAKPESKPAEKPAAQAAPAPLVSLPLDSRSVEITTEGGETKIKLNVQDAPIQSVLEYLSEKVGLTIVSKEPIAANRITVISRQALLLKDVINLINTMLKERGLNAILQDKTLKIITLAEAPKEIIPVRIARDPNSIIPTDSVVTYVIPVAHISATALVQNLQSMLPEYATITANSEGNALIITDTTANIQRLMRIISALDTHMATVAEIRIWPLRNADATTTATLINTIFQQQATGAGGRGGFGGRGGAGGNPLQMMMQMATGGRFGGGPGGGPGGRGGQQGAGLQSTGNVNVGVIAAADAQTNSVVVRGPKESLDLVDNIIKALDDINTKVASVRVFQLKYADATNTADVINQLFGQQRSTSGGTRGGRGGGFGPGGPIFQGPFGAQGNQQQTGSSLVAVTAAADSRTNTIVVTGPESVLGVVEQVIKQIDTPLQNVADVKVFRLEYADAANTATLINEVFGQSRSSSARSGSRTSSQQSQQIQFMGARGGGSGGMMGAQGTQGGTSSDVTVVASSDTRTNSVVVSGPPETLAVIAQIIKELDANPAQERRIFVYPLKNGTASSLMTILNSLFQQMQTLNQRTTGTRTTTTGGQRNAAGGGMAVGGAGGGPGGGAAATGTSTSDSLSEETYFQADPNTNSLLIMTSSKNYAKVKPIIEELDKPVGQVLIKVLFAELTHNDSLDWGSEFSMLNLRGKGNGNQSIGAFGRPIDSTTPGSIASTTNPNTLGAGATGSSGLSVRTLQGDLDLTLHALQDKGKLNVLSRPYILTRNNRLATITVADEVPIPTGTTNQGSVGSTTTFSYRNDIGIVLEVTPSINEDGLVNMIVSPKITTQTGQTVQIAQGVNPMVFSTRSATTRVAVLNGQTIVIGGLIQDQSSSTIRKVPLLGDIPIMGNLFKRTQKTKSKTELLIFLTPFVAKEPTELSNISEAEEKRSTIDKDKEGAELYRKHMEAMKNTAYEPNEVVNTQGKVN